MQLFQCRPLQLSIASEKEVLLEPISVYDAQSPVQFRIAALDEFLSSEIYVLCETKLINGDNTDIVGGDPPGDKVAPTPNYAHSMWQGVEISINGTLISGRTRLYPYRAYFENVYLTMDQAKNTWINGAGCYWYYLVNNGNNNNNAVLFRNPSL